MVALQNEIQAMMNIGLIGCGMWGRNLARNLAQLEVLAAVADRHTENAAEFGSAFAAKPVDVDTLIHDQSIDGIVIATAAPSHDSLAIAALAAGKHVYVEKPLSLSLGGAKAIQDAAHAAKKQVMVGHLDPLSCRLYRIAETACRWCHWQSSPCSGKPVGNGAYSQYRICFV